ncbi:MAG TPA: IS66 family insertion sequence element accessory protein TnpB [Opitutaceae bacterium]|jgi:transposase
MITIGGRTRIFLATGVTDLRRGFGLQAVIEHDLGCPPLNGDVYLFANRRRDMVKAFFFDSGGTWVCAKRLTVGSFRWPAPGQTSLELTAAELQLLLSGLDLTKTRPRRWWQPPASIATATTPRSPSLGDPAAGR